MRQVFREGLNRVAGKQSDKSGKQVRVKGLRSTFLERLRYYFFAGILVTAPLAITFWLVWKFVTFVDSQVRPYIPAQWNPETYLPFGLPGLGLIVIALVLILIGFMTAGFLGRFLTRVSESVVKRLPLVRSLYSWVKQVIETVLSQKSSAFREVVLVEYPCRGSWAVGFITGETKGEVQELTDDTVVNVFVPATPNPTTGFLLFIPAQDVHHLDMSVEEGIKLVISGGIVTPAVLKELEEQKADRESREARNNRIKAKRERKQKEEESKRQHRSGLLVRLRNYFFAGMLITAPIGISIWLTWEVILLIDAQVIAYVPLAWRPENYLPFAVPGVGVVGIFLFLVIVGFFTAGILGRTLINLSERLLDQMPVVRTLYGALKQIMETVFKQQSRAFSEVVLIEYPRKGSWALGFYTGDSHEDIREISAEESVNVFLPTTPNPTSGFLLFVPRKEAQILSMTVEEGIKMVVSGGIVTPENRAAGKPAKKQ